MLEAPGPSAAPAPASYRTLQPVFTGPVNPRLEPGPPREDDQRRPCSGTARLPDTKTRNPNVSRSSLV